MKSSYSTPVFFLALCSLALSGCHRVKPVVLLPQQAPASTHTDPPPDQSQAATTTASETPEQPATAKPDDPATNTNASSGTPVRPRPRRHPSTAQKPTPQVPAGTNGNGRPVAEEARNAPPPKITVGEGGTDSRPGPGQISPGISHNEAIHSAASTDQLLESTDTNLRNIKRQLSTDEQSIVAQIHDYISQSRQATKDGDLVRAHNLALKAHLLSDDLAKQR